MEWIQCNIYYRWSKQCPSLLLVLSGSMFLLHTGYITQFWSRTFTPVNSTHPEEGSESRSSVVSQQEDLRSQLGHLQKYNFSFYKTYLIVSAEMEMWRREGWGLLFKTPASSWLVRTSVVEEDSPFWDRLNVGWGEESGSGSYSSWYWQQRER